MEKVSEETRALRRTMRDLVALSALPAVWAGYRAPQVAEGLAEVLRSTLHLDLVYIRLPGQATGPGIEVARTTAATTPTDQARDIGRTLAPWLESATFDSAPSLATSFPKGCKCRSSKFSNEASKIWKSLRSFAATAACLNSPWATSGRR